ncbi:MAG: carbohydrate ABC transporter permease [Candidatus Hydrogenedentes bacterium]|nr:carbohydrate ABC transporter permease [Candidatus Hydrogenedentota bacterium]
MKRALHGLFLAAGAALCIYPFLWMAAAGFKTLTEATTPSLRLLPEVWQWQNLRLTLEAAPFLRYFLNSVFVGACTAALIAVTALGAGYALACIAFRGRGLVFAFVLLTMMVPFEMTLIPNFVLVGRLGWYNSFAALIVPWCANGFSIFLVRQMFSTIPRDYFDAARIDGCGHFQFLLAIGAPLVKPALITAALFAFLGSYNSLLWPLVVTTDVAHRVIQVGLTVFATDSGVRLNLLMCASAIVIAPVALLYFLFQQHVMNAAISSGLKG